MSDTEKGIAKKTRRGIAWTLVGAVVSNVLRIAVIAILSRLLLPSEFGAVAAAMIVIYFGKTIKDMGVGLALVQRPKLDPEHIETAFTFSVFSGSLFAAVTYVCAPLIARAFEIEPSVDMLRALALIFLIRGFAVVPMFICRRNMDFRAVALVDTSGYVAGSALSIVLAFVGYGAWSLVYGYLLGAIVELALLLYFVPPPRLRFSLRHLKELLGFGLGQTLASVANYFANQGDYMVVGYFLGPTQLGLYQRAYELIRFPANLFTTVAGTVLFSAFAKVQNDKSRLAHALRRTMFASALVLLPASVGLIVLAPEAIRLLLGSNWDEVVGPFRVMACAMLFRTTYKVGGLVARSSGQVYTLAALQVVYALAVIGGAVISVQWGIFGVACTTTLAVTIHFVNLTTLGLRVTGLSVRELLRAHIMPLAVAVFVGGAALGVASSLRTLIDSNATIVITTSICGAIVFLACVTIAGRGEGGEWPWLRESIRKALRKKRGLDQVR